MKLRVVTSKNLSIDDVKNNFMDYNFQEDQDSWKPNEIEKGFLIIHGVHQEGNTATVSISLRYKGIVDSKRCSLVRFNSGKWYVIPEGVFLKK